MHPAGGMVTFIKVGQSRTGLSQRSLSQMIAANATMDEECFHSIAAIYNLFLGDARVRSDQK